MDEYSYHAFISYRSPDRSWASRLATDLRAQNVKCFLDTTDIRKGEGWEQQILKALLASRHLVLLWTPKTGGSDWVDQELNRFRQIIDPTGEGKTGGRLVIAINLEGKENETLKAIQQHNMESLQKAYSSTPASATLENQALQDWKEVVGEIAESVTDMDPRVPVSVVVFAPTKAILQQDRLSPPVLGTEVEDFLEKVGITGEKYSDRYDGKPEEWKPYGTQDTIEQILRELLVGEVGVNTKLRALAACGATSLF